MGTSGDQTIGLGYNPASQIVSRTGTNDSYAWTGSVAVNRPYTVNGLNQYTTAGPATFAYDLNGNLTSDGTTSFVYDVENRLVSASGGKTAAVVYDPLGRLFQTSGGAAGITQFLYDDDALIAEYNGSGGITNRYIHGTAKGVDDPLIWFTVPASGWRQALVADPQGSIIAVADKYGNPVAINSYDAWGIPGANNAGRFGYTGQAWIPELGLWYYKARFYSPTTGRFMQTDPVGYKDQMNLYAYVGNDPVNRNDPSGKTCTSNQSSGRDVYSCRIDKVFDFKTGKTRAPTAAEEKRFAGFNARYTAAVNRLMSQPDKTVTIGAVQAGNGSFEMTRKEAGLEMADREFVYVDQAHKKDLLSTGGGFYAVMTNPVTLVRPSGLEGVGQAGIVHDGALHGSFAEWTGGLQNADNPLGQSPLDRLHQEPYNRAGCELLGGKDC